jgi:transcriptional regulator with XRE-family HTH domain
MRKHDELILLGKRIRSLRESQGYSQESFAFLIDVNRGYFGAIERGEVNISFLNLLKIVDGLQISLALFFNGCRIKVM